MNINYLIKNYIYILLGLLVIGILIPGALNREIPGRDSGVFLYVGQQILNGKIPYLDVWDHKPPLIYYIDSLGLIIGNGSTWGVLFLEFLALYFAVILGFILLRHAFGIIPAFFGSVVWLLSSVLVLQGGNLTEEFALPLQFILLYLFLSSERLKSYSWRGFLIGVISALTFFVKPNIIGIALSVLVFILITRIISRSWGTLLKDLILIFLGASSIAIIVFVFFTWHNAINSLFDQVFHYNSIYSTTTLWNRILSIRTGYGIFSASGISFLAFSSFIMAIFYFCFGKNHIENRNRPLVYLSIIGLPIELFLVSISGRPYAHYYITLLPILAILSSFFAYTITKNANQSEVIFRSKKIKMMTIMIFVLLFSMIVWPTTFIFYDFIKPHNLKQDLSYNTIEYIKNTTNTSDYVLMWGAETRINFVTRRQSPTRFVYQYPLYTQGYQSKEMIKEFLNDIKFNKPILIIDSSPSNPTIPPINRSARNKWIGKGEYGQPWGLLPEMDYVFEYIDTHYELIETTEKEQWPVYKYIDEKKWRGWLKFEGNPVLGGNLGTVFDISVLKEDNIFRMWFSWRPKSSIALVESKDGIHWSEPVIVFGPNEATGWEEAVNRPIVLKRPDGYHMWYTGQTDKHSYIGHAISPDGKRWTRTSDKPVLLPDQPWEKEAVMVPHVLWDEDEHMYKMWYSGGEQYEPDAIGYAVSSDGQIWSKRLEPVFLPSSEFEWDSYKVTGGQVIRQDGWYLMFYIGFRDDHHAQIGLARSRDGISNWQRHHANPIIEPGLYGGWDSDAVYKPYAILNDNQWYLWYNARRSNVEQIGLAIHEGRDLGFDNTS